MTFDKLTSALNKGGQYLGDLIWWTLASNRFIASSLPQMTLPRVIQRNPGASHSTSLTAAAS